MALKVYRSGLDEFEAWSGAVHMWEYIKKNGLVDVFEAFLLECAADENGFINETMVNDILWFESDGLFEWMGIELDGDGGIDYED